jgi:hypothetical protein
MWQEDGEKSIMRSFLICTPLWKIFWWPDEEWAELGT